MVSFWLRYPTNVSSATSVIMLPAASVMGMWSLSAPVRMTGPCVSHIVAAGFPLAAHTRRYRSSTCWWYARVPCARLIFATSMPASSMRDSTSSLSQRGPMVAMIFVLRTGACGPVTMESEMLVARRLIVLAVYAPELLSLGTLRCPGARSKYICRSGSGSNSGTLVSREDDLLPPTRCVAPSTITSRPGGHSGGRWFTASASATSTMLIISFTLLTVFSSRNGNRPYTALHWRASTWLDVSTITGQLGRYLATRRIVLPPSEKATIMPGCMSFAFLAAVATNASTVPTGLGVKSRIKSYTW